MSGAPPVGSNPSLSIQTPSDTIQSPNEKKLAAVNTLVTNLLKADQKPGVQRLVFIPRHIIGTISQGLKRAIDAFSVQIPKIIESVRKHIKPKPQVSQVQTAAQEPPKMMDLATYQEKLDEISKRFAAALQGDLEVGVLREAANNAELNKVNSFFENPDVKLEDVIPTDPTPLFWAGVLKRAANTVLDKCENGTIGKAGNSGTEEYKKMQQWCLNVASTIKAVYEGKNSKLTEQGLKTLFPQFFGSQLLGIPEGLFEKYNIKVEVTTEPKLMTVQIGEQGPPKNVSI